jgi:hypothetical protein
MYRVNCEPSQKRNAVKPRRFKLEFYDDDGVRHTITIDGQITREKVGKLLDLVEGIAGTPRASATVLGMSPRKYDRLASTIIATLRDRTFTAAEAKKSFESSFPEKIQSSTVSTYLTRLVDRGILERTPAGRNIVYRVKSEEPRSILSLHS